VHSFLLIILMSLPVIIGRVEGVLGEKDPAGEMRKDPGK
jgi:hypothetical protein